MSAPRVLVVMGSDSDFEQLSPAWQVLDELGVGYEVRVASAHRTPAKAIALATSAREAGFGVIIAGAGGAAHLAGVLAAHTTVPVIAMPVAMGTLGGMDALLSAVQMPPGVPIASVGIGGAANAGLFATAILSVQDPELAQRLADYRKARATKVAAADQRVQAKLGQKSG
jgi:phosphoribosylaminoimidazole carboxylase PurE protein